MTENRMIENLYVEETSLQHTENLLAKIKFKPVGPLYVAYICAPLLLLFGHLYAIIIAVCIVLFALIVQFVVKDRNTLDLYESYLLVHKLDDETYVRKINYADIIEWTCRTKDGTGSVVMLKMSDEDVVFKDTFQAPKVHKVLDTIIPEKETSELRRLKEREKTKNYHFSIKNLKNIGNIFKKK